MTFFGTAHEVAHSWWGGQVRGALVRGRAVPLGVARELQRHDGDREDPRPGGGAPRLRLPDGSLSQPARGLRDATCPLLEVEDQPHIAYGKGAVAMYTLREQHWRRAVNTALRRFLEKHRDGGPPYPTSLDLVRELRAVTPDSLQYLLTDLFETVTLWDVKTERAVVARTARRRSTEVTLDVVAKKMRADSVGHETETPMDDFVEIGVFAPGKATASASRSTCSSTASAAASRRSASPFRASRRAPASIPIAS